MAPIKPQDVKSPKSRINPNKIKVLYDGTIKGKVNFSIAELELKDDPNKPRYGIRYDNSGWSKNPEKGYPLSRGHACWFILPDQLFIDGELDNIIARLKTDI